MENGFHGFLPEGGRNSRSFTIVQNHFTSPIVVKGFEFYRGTLKSLFVYSRARCGVRVWLCRHLWVGQSHISRVSYRLIGRSFVSIAAGRHGYWLYKMHTSRINFNPLRRVLLERKKKKKKRAGRTRESSILFAHAVSVFFSVARLLGIWFDYCGNTVDIPLQRKNIDWKIKKFLFQKLNSIL